MGMFVAGRPSRVMHKFHVIKGYRNEPSQGSNRLGEHGQYREQATSSFANVMTRKFSFARLTLSSLRPDNHWRFPMSEQNTLKQQAPDAPLV